MNRRSVLQLGGLALAGSVAGCSALSSDSPDTVRVSEVEVRNRVGSPVDVSLLLVDDGELAYWRTKSVPISPDPAATFDDLPDAAGEYTLHAQVPTVDGGSRVTADLVEDAGGRSCITVSMEVAGTTSTDGDPPSVVYGAIGECSDSN